MEQARKELIAFTALCFAFLWIPCALFIFYNEPLHAAFKGMFGDTVPPFALLVLGAYSPSLLGFILTAVWRGRAGLKEFLARTLRWRVPLKWWAIALLAYPIAFLIQKLILQAAGGPPVEFSLWYQVLPVLILSGFIFQDSGALGEEFGLRGYALPRLLMFMTPFNASLLLGFVWSVWHLPAFFIGEFDHSQWNFMIFLLLPVGIAFFMTWLHINTSGSALVSGMAPHMMANAMNGAKIQPAVDLPMLLVFLAVGAIALYFGRKDFMRRSDDFVYLDK